jgi:hypothetical protein
MECEGAIVGSDEFGRRLMCALTLNVSVMKQFFHPLEGH